ncbi:hypothetical protein DSM112329_01144 [Paraconexibacter sp. AEG42_29]|uniref:Membrane transport protein MMPL domain-containing protein n=1 Tax=Paraconexibacter sp. AEG42_29 TaxID=2997339 RepID=A0AAU7AS46_9ACTN
MTRLYARVVVWLRWPVAVAMIAGVAVAAVELPALSTGGASGLGSLVPPDSRAVAAEQDASERLGAPILSRTLLVQRRPAGLTAADQRAIVRQAAAVPRASGGRVLGAVPYVNHTAVTPHGGERATTAVTGLFFGPDVAPLDQPEVARDVVDRLRPPHAAGITGSLPAQAAQGDLILDRLPLVEIATAVLVALLVGLYFRSPVAPLLTLGAVAMTYLLTDRMLAQLATHSQTAIPQEVQPVLVVLLFGVVTDYCIFFLSRARTLLDEGQGRLEAAIEATTAITGIVTAAAATVAAASLALLVSDLQFLRAFGPGMAGAVALAWLVVVLFVPASLAILGRRAFWPRPRPVAPLTVAEATAVTTPADTSRLVRLSVHHPFVACVLCLVVLGAGVSGLAETRLGNPLMASAQEGSEVRRGYEAAKAGAGPGVVAPTVVLLRRAGLQRDDGQVASFQRWLERRPGVAGVLGPADAGFAAPRRLSLQGDEARLVLIFRDDPLGGRAVEGLRAITAAAPAALADRGLAGARLTFAGDTAITAEMARTTVASLLKIGALILAVLFLILAVYLRALIAPLYLLASSVLALLAALGLTTYLFQGALGHDGLSYFTVIVAGVLLVALGSDYNVFLAGDVWREAKDRPAREAIVTAASRTSKPIALAGVVLALSFALLALVPVTLFREIAVVMVIGLLLDAFLVRKVLVPALISAFGSVGSRRGDGVPRRGAGRPAVSPAGPPSP